MIVDGSVHDERGIGGRLEMGGYRNTQGIAYDIVSGLTGVYDPSLTRDMFVLNKSKHLNCVLFRIFF